MVDVPTPAQVALRDQDAAGVDRLSLVEGRVQQGDEGAAARRTPSLVTLSTGTSRDWLSPLMYGIAAQSRNVSLVAHSAGVAVSELRDPRAVRLVPAE